MIPRSSILILAMSLFANAIAAQVSDEDKTAAIQSARQFTQQMRRTQDVGVVIPEFFRPDFLQEIDGDSRLSTLVLLEASDRPKITLPNGERRKYYLASQNLFYLMFLYQCWQDPNSFKKDLMDLKDVSFPPGVRQVVDKTIFLRLMLQDQDHLTNAEIDAGIPKTARDVKVLTDNFERMNDLFRRRMKPLRQMSDVQFDEIVGKCQSAERPYYEVELIACDVGDCHGLPSDATLISVSVPVFPYIDFMRVNSKIKAVRLSLFGEALQ